jgi:subtilisin family serine protease
VKSSPAAVSAAVHVALAVGHVALPGGIPLAAADAPAAPLVRHLRDLRAVADDDGRIPVLVAVPDGASAASLGLSPIVPGFAGGRLSPADLLGLESSAPGLRVATGPRKQPHVDRATGSTATRTQEYRAQTGLVGRGVVVGVVDTGIDVSHRTFRDLATGKTRIAWLLSGGAPRGVHAELEQRFGCLGELGPCAVWSAADIDAALEAQEEGVELPADLRDGSGHGTHVAGIAAGNGNWPVFHVGEEPEYVGMAPEATLIIGAPASAAGFADPDILNGTAFIFDRADEMGLPAVVNLSLGGDFGPHDGTSLLEKALATFVGDDRPGHAIVVSSGNSAGLIEIGDDLGGVHTEARVRPHASVRVPLVMAAPEGGSAFVWITMRPGDEVSVGVEGPEGETWIAPIAPGDEAGYEEGSSSAVVINNLVNGRSDLTADTNGAVLVIGGEFDDHGEDVAVVLEGEGDAQLWVTPADSIAFFRRGVSQGTVAVPATHPRLIAVGSSISRALWTTIDGDRLSAGSLDGDALGGISTFSSCGPTASGVAKPELVAPGQFIVSAVSADADPRTSDAGIFESQCPGETEGCLLVAEGYGVSAGTSMASPLAAGAIALLLDRDPNLTQGRIVEILQAGARAYTGTVVDEAQKGPGDLDMLGALAAFAGEDAASGAPPDPAASYWTISSAYARPDPTWPIEGLVQLRRADGTLASGLDGSLLELEVGGGLVQKAPTKVRHGTFAFTVSGKRGTEGTTLSVRVLYDGVAIGETKLLPVGGDAFSASEPPQALGGCSCMVPAGVARGAAVPRDALALALASIAVLGARRRRSRR